MRQETDCAALRGYLQDCLDRRQSPATDKTQAHLAVCPECRAWQKTLLGAAGGLRAALSSEVEALPPVPPGALYARARDRQPRRRRRLGGIAAALVLAVGLSAAAAGIYSRQRAAAMAEAGSEYLMEVIFADNLLDSADPGLALEGDWLAGTLETENLYSMEPLTVF